MFSARDSALVVQAWDGIKAGVQAMNIWSH